MLVVGENAVVITIVSRQEILEHFEAETPLLEAALDFGLLDVVGSLRHEAGHLLGEGERVCEPGEGTDDDEDLSSLIEIRAVAQAVFNEISDAQFRGEISTPSAWRLHGLEDVDEHAPNGGAGYTESGMSVYHLVDLVGNHTATEFLVIELFVDTGAQGFEDLIVHFDVAGRERYVHVWVQVKGGLSTDGGDCKRCLVILAVSMKCSSQTLLGRPTYTQSMSGERRCRVG